MAEPQPNAFDPTPWLRRPKLELVEIFALMRGKDPTDSKGISRIQLPLLRALKIEIDGGELHAGRFEGGRVFLRSYIHCENLVGFVSPRKDDPVWSSETSEIDLWGFCRHWADVCEVTFPSPRSAPFAVNESGLPTNAEIDDALGEAPAAAEAVDPEIVEKLRALGYID